jgi:prepilin peptidase CpaA
MDYVFILLTVVMVAAFYTDVTKKVIPNVMTVPAVLCGLVYHAVTGGWTGLVFSCIGAIASFLPLLLLYSFGGVGAGDVKLFAAIGAIAGTEYGLYCLMYSIVYGGIIGLVILLFRKELLRKMWSSLRSLFGFFLYRTSWRTAEASGKKERLRFPFMYAVLPGALTAYWYM